MAWNLEKEIGQERDYLNGTYHDEDRAERVADVEDNLASDKQSALALIAFGLSGLARCEAREGVVRVFDGDSTGWENIHRSCIYSCWEARIYITRYDAVRHTDPSLVADDMATTLDLATQNLAYAIGMKQEKWADYFGRRLVAALNDGSMEDDHWFIYVFEPFMIQLYARWRGLDVDITADDRFQFGIYRWVFDDWEGNEDLTRAIYQMCEFHCNGPDDRNIASEFATPPYDMIPVEMLALRRIRSDLGLETPKVEHPLLESPFAHPPKRFPKLKDPLLDRVIAKYRSIHGDA